MSFENCVWPWTHQPNSDIKSFYSFWQFLSLLSQQSNLHSRHITILICLFYSEFFETFLHLSAYWLACAQIFNSFHLTSMEFGDFWLVWGFFCCLFFYQTWEIIAHYLKKHLLHYFYLHSRTPVLCCMITDYILIFVSFLVSVPQNNFYLSVIKFADPFSFIYNFLLVSSIFF